MPLGQENANPVPSSDWLEFYPIVDLDNAKGNRRNAFELVGSPVKRGTFHLHESQSSKHPHRPVLQSRIPCCSTT